MKYGFFDEKNKEYVITNPKTPTPWINYLGTDKYCGIISNNAGGYSFYLSPKSGRILRYRYNNIPWDRPGRYIYIYDSETGDFWSNSWQPVAKDLSRYIYEVRHGLGYSKFICLHDTIETQTIYFVPMEENLEIWWLKIKNKGEKTRILDIFSYAEFAFWTAIGDLTDLQYILNICYTKLTNQQIIDYKCSFANGEIKSVYAFVTQPISSFDTDRDKFIGIYKDESAPEGVINGKLSNSYTIGNNPCAAFHNRIEIQPLQEKEIVYVIGIGDAEVEGAQIKKKYINISNVKEEFEKVNHHWENILSKFTCTTPDPEFNLLINTWLPYQCHVTFNWSRSASYYETGTQRDGLGFRDSNQDCLAVISSIPQKVRKRILDLGSAIYQSGNACHTFQPVTGEGYGNNDYSDDHLWFVLTVAEYLKETGDFTVLEEIIPYYDGSKGSVFEHLQKTLDYTSAKLGSHGLCLGLRADWNDCLNLAEGGESVWTTQLFYKALIEFCNICEATNKLELNSKYISIAEKIKNTLNEVAWDGEWYLRAFTGSGKKVGSKENKEGKIYLNSNTWAVFSGIAEPQKGKTALDKVFEYLYTQHGLLLFAPPYTKFDPELGAISSFPAGLKENASIFCHPNSWAVIAETIIGNGDRAYKYFTTVMPIRYNDKADIRKVEPYVYCQFVAGKHHPNFGEGKNSWLTGTASWMYVAATQYILGIRPTFNGLLLDPCIPKDWSNFSVKREFRGCVYDISVENPHHISKGLQNTIYVNGEKIKGNIVPISAKNECKVKVVLG